MSEVRLTYRRLGESATYYYPHIFEMDWPHSHTDATVKEISEWCDERFHTGYWYFSHGSFKFRYEQHALEFRMRWC